MQLSKVLVACLALATSVVAAPQYEKPKPPGPPAPVTGPVTASKKLPSVWKWEASEPIISPKNDSLHTVLAVKDPSIVWHGGKFHVIATAVTSLNGSDFVYKMIYLNFKDFESAHKAPHFHLDQVPGFDIYGCAPQVFYFTPHKLWYLIFQSPNPTYSTNKDISNPKGWSVPKIMVETRPDLVTAEKGPQAWEDWIDYWTLCDKTHCHLYYSNDYGDWFRQETPRSQFPLGWGPAYSMWNDTNLHNMFEGSAVYKVKGENKYLGLHEATGPNNAWERYYRAFIADSPRGPFVPIPGTFPIDTPFAGRLNTKFSKKTKWAQAIDNSGISHGELVRDSYDEYLEVNPCDLQLLFQGITGPNDDYLRLPYKLGIAEFDGKYIKECKRN